MNKKLLPWILLICALGLSGTAAYYSVVGLSIVFSGVAIPVIIMGGFLEISKLAIATYLHNQWKNSYFGLKLYLTLALVILSVITSIGIYGLLASGFRDNITKLEISTKQVQNIEVKKSRFEQSKQEYVLEKQSADQDISNLRLALSNGTTTQYKDRETGQIITRISSTSRRSFENQLTKAIANRDTLSKKIETMNDSLTKLDFQILDMETSNEESNELGVIQSVSESTGWPITKVANIFILVLIVVFDPLAISLVLATNQAFKSAYPPKPQPKEPTPTPQPTPQPKPIDPKPQPNPQEVQRQIQILQTKINELNNSSASSKKRGLAIKQLNQELQSLQSQNRSDQKEY